MGIAGVEGNGQTELIEVFSGMLKPTGGQVIFEGKDVTAQNVRERREGGMSLSLIHISKNNREGIQAALSYLKTGFDGLLFVNLVDFDMLYGHRNNPLGYAEALEYFDTFGPEMVSLLKEDDSLLITADHGCDPTTPGTDHTREYICLLYTSNREDQKRV